MLTLQDIKKLMKDAPKGFKTPEDAFFKSSNKTFQNFKKLGVITVEPSETENVTNANGTNPIDEIHCNIPGCQEVFNSVSTYQIHFNTLHRYICAQCRRSLPTAHLLDLHLSEIHDSYFAACVERGNAEYKCYLEECKQKLRSPNERKKHCISVHKFPANYRFDQLKGKKQKKKRNRKSRPDIDGAKSSDSMDESDMQVDAGAKKGHKTYTFGHQRARFAGGSKRDSGKAFDTMTDLMDALDD